jgi:hypothetical protein
MGIDGDEWIALVGTGASVRILPSGPPELGWPARFELKAGSLAIERAYELGDVQAFCDQISNMHRTLTGSTSLGDWDHQLDLSLEMKSLGTVEVRASVCEFGSFEIDLKVRFQIDQSYLPAFVQSMRTGFEKQAWQ